MLELLIALNFNAPDCPDYWVNPRSQKIECLYQDKGRLVKVQPRSGAELFLREAGSDYYIDRARLQRRGVVVVFPLVQKMSQPIDGVSQITYWHRVNCQNGKSAIDFLDVGQGLVKNPTNRARSSFNKDMQRLVREVCR